MVGLDRRGPHLSAVAVIRVRLLDVPLNRDEGEYAYFGQLLLQGIPPYASAYNFKLPGIYVAYAAILAVLGQTPAAIHVGLLIVNAVSIVLMFLVARRLIGTLGGLASSATYAALTLSPRLFSPSAYAEHFVVVPVLLGVLVLARTSRRERLITLFGAGALFGVAFLVKQSGGVFALFGLVSSGRRSERPPPEDDRRRDVRGRHLGALRGALSCHAIHGRVRRVLVLDRHVRVLLRDRRVGGSRRGQPVGGARL